MSAQIVLSPDGERDVSMLLEYLLERNPTAARRLRQRIEETLVRLGEREFDGREVLLRTGEQVRRWVVRPVVIYYQRAQDSLWIVRIYHHAREPLEE